MTGIISLTKALAGELAPSVRVNTVAPSNVETEWVKEQGDEEINSGRRENLIGHFGTLEEVAKVIAFLCWGDSTFMNGQRLVLDGGGILHRQFFPQCDRKGTCAFKILKGRVHS